MPGCGFGKPPRIPSAISQESTADDLHRAVDAAAAVGDDRIRRRCRARISRRPGPTARWPTGEVAQPRASIVAIRRLATPSPPGRCLTDVESRRAVVVTGALDGDRSGELSRAWYRGRFLGLCDGRRLEDADGLREQFGDSVGPLLMDLDEDSVRAAGAEVYAGGPLFGLVNNARSSDLLGPWSICRSIPSGANSRSISPDSCLSPRSCFPRSPVGRAGRRRTDRDGRLHRRSDRWADAGRLSRRQARTGGPDRGATGRACAVRDSSVAHRAGDDRHPDLENGRAQGKELQSRHAHLRSHATRSSLKALRQD